MPQFEVKAENISGNAFTIKGDEAKHLLKSVRIKSGDTIYLVALGAPGEPGKRYSAVVGSTGRNEVSGKILCEITGGGIGSSGINIFAALIKPDRFETMLEKLTEIGVDALTPVITERTVGAYAAPSPNKIERWNKVMRAAAKQCCCEKIPELKKTLEFDAALRGLPQEGLNLIAWEHYLDEENKKTGARTVPAITEIAGKLWKKAIGQKMNIFFGPEGGFSDKEIALARESGLIPFTLGKNIMRAETAAIVAAGSAMLVSESLRGVRGADDEVMPEADPPWRAISYSKIVSLAEMRELDGKAIEEYGIPGIALMENAGKEVAAAAAEITSGPRIAVFCGTGNNGGDGLVAARFLYNAGCSVRIFLLKKAEDFKGDALTNYSIVKKMNIPVEEMPQGGIPDISAFDVIIDAMLGTGLRENVSGLFLEIIRHINRSGKPVVSADIPSGLNGDTGEPMGDAVRASVTVAMGFIKKGMSASAAKDYAGRIIVADIGIPG